MKNQSENNIDIGHIVGHTTYSIIVPYMYDSLKHVGSPQEIAWGCEILVHQELRLIGIITKCECKTAAQCCSQQIVSLQSDDFLLGCKRLEV